MNSRIEPPSAEEVISLPCAHRQQPGLLEDQLVWRMLRERAKDLDSGRDPGQSFSDVFGKPLSGYQPSANAEVKKR